MSRDAYVGAGGGGNRSPRGVRRGELPTVDRSPSRAYPGGSPLGRKPLRQTRSGNNSPDHGGYGYSPYYSRDDDLGSPMLEERGRPSAHHRSRSASRPSNPMSVRYASLDRGGTDHDREFLPIRDRSLDRRERPLYLDEELYGGRSRQSPAPHQPYLGELQHQNSDLQRELGNLKKELELTNQKLGSSMHSIKTFWSPELKKERALRKEESAKYSLINDQLKLLSNENQKQAMLVRQLEEELRMRMRGPSIEMQQQMEVLFQENEHLTREIAILRDTIKELELRIETQKQTLQARDESIKKLLEMLQNKGMGKEEERQMFQQMQAMAQKQLDEFRVEIQRRDQEILAMGAKMKTLEEQHQDYQRHIAVLKESLCAKEEHYNMLQADCEELRQRLDEKNRHIEKKTQAATQAQQERTRINSELTELREHMEIKDRKINVLQRKLDLLEANKKIQNSSQMNQNQKPNEDMSGIKRQLDEQRKQLEEQRKSVDNKHRQVDEKEKALLEVDKELKKRKEQMDQLEASLRKAGGGAAAAGELNKKLSEAEKKLEKAQDEAQRSAGEMERLLQLVQMSQEEQNSKEKTIMELQQSLKGLQTKLKSQQQATAQMEEQRKKEEICLYDDLDKDVVAYLAQLETTTNGHDEDCDDKNQCNHHNLRQLAKVVANKNRRIEQLEFALRESLQLTTEREHAMMNEEAKRKLIMGKVNKLEQRLLSLQTAQGMRCHNCRPTVRRMATLQAKLEQLVSERRRHLHDVANMKREALEAAISERDAHLALLEISGVKSARQADEMDKIRADRRRLMEKLKKENELSMALNQEYDSTDYSTLDLTVEEDDES